MTDQTYDMNLYICMNRVERRYKAEIDLDKCAYRDPELEEEFQNWCAAGGTDKYQKYWNEEVAV